MGEAGQGGAAAEVFRMTIDAAPGKPANLYVHFPFCRRKCSYCALHSRAGASEAERNAYASSLVESACGEYRTAYFGGGSPALCDLRPLLAAIKAKEFTVELNPLDVTDELLRTLRDGGVNRISMGVQSLDDAVLADMGRGYDFYEAERAFAKIREYFDNAGIDIIVGYPGESVALTPRHARLAKWGLRHCSVYSLILEEKTQLWRRVNGAEKLELPDDDTVMNRLAVVAAFLKDLGLERYEISNYAVPGYECKHNMAVWRGEDYLGLGEGAHGRVGRVRTPSGETLSEEADRKERTLFRLRTSEGIDASGYPEWLPILEKYVREGLLVGEGAIFRLTERGFEVCDSILADLV